MRRSQSHRKKKSRWGKKFKTPNTILVALSSWNSLQSARSVMTQHGSTVEGRSQPGLSSAAFEGPDAETLSSTCAGQGLQEVGLGTASPCYLRTRVSCAEASRPASLCSTERPSPLPPQCYAGHTTTGTGGTARLQNEHEGAAACVQRASKTVKRRS